MSKKANFASSLLVALPAWLVIYFTVMALTTQLENMSTMVMVLVILLLTVASGVGVILPGFILIGPGGNRATGSKKADVSAKEKESKPAPSAKKETDDELADDEDFHEELDDELDDEFEFDEEDE